jgi:hypothetical protein
MAAASKTPLVDFLVLVGKDEKLLALVWASRAELVKKGTELTDQHRKILVEGKLSEIRKAIHDELGEADAAFWVLGPSWVLVRI